jgi:alkylation response protein AidB-like acyl-CoA dehydrogenase
LIEDTDELQAFRQEVRSFVREALPADIAERTRGGYHLSREELFRWHRALAARGWAGVNWPVEFGGPGWTPQQRQIFDQEYADAGAPILVMTGLNQTAALLFAFGTPEQQQRHLPYILDGSQTWCQGFSEPQAGSDLANLRCAAVREGDHYVVNGTKLWTTAAHYANWCILLVRTSSAGKKQEGITILLMDMALPGITVRPIIGLDGMHSLNEVFLDNVRIPVGCRVGEEGKGWSLMRVFLGHERISAAGIWKFKAHFSRLCAIARTEIRNGKPLIEQARFRDELAAIEIRMRALEAILLDIFADPAKSTGIEASLLKLAGTEVQQDLLRLTSDAAGYYAIPFLPEVMKTGWVEEQPIGPEFAAPATPNYLFWRKGSISGGSSEIMLNMIADAVLGRA